MNQQITTSPKVFVAVYPTVSDSDLAALIADARGEMEAAWKEQTLTTKDEGYSQQAADFATARALICEQYFHNLVTIQERRLSEARRLLARRDANRIAYHAGATLSHFSTTSEAWVFYGKTRMNRAFELIDHLRINGIPFTMQAWTPYGIRVSF